MVQLETGESKIRGLEDPVSGEGLLSRYVLIWQGVRFQHIHFGKTQTFSLLYSTDLLS